MTFTTQQKRVWALSVLFASCSFIFWLQIGLNAITESEKPIADVLAVDAMDREEPIVAASLHVASPEHRDLEVVYEEQTTPERAIVDSPLRAWELRRAFGIHIPSLDLRAPVLLPSRTHWDARNWELLEEQMQAGMLLGTVAYPHSRRPGAEGGALIVAGHSSPPSQEARESAYGNIFASLPQLQRGDEIIVTDGDERFTYTVTDTFVVHAEDTGILDLSLANNSLTLMTCYPVGTTRQRFVVKAKLQ